MEPADIDWKNIVSRYERDEVYERINAPKWLDLSAPNRPIDDVSWFCRPDCRHPNTVEDFDRWTPSPKVKPLRSNSEANQHGKPNKQQRDANLKTRAAVATFIPSPSGLKLNSKKYREDLENQNPNKRATPPTVKAKKMAVVAKEETGNSSAQKKGDAAAEKEAEVAPRKKAQTQQQLKVTNSARNLFSGKDILSQISEFCHELKRLATGKEASPIRVEEKDSKRKFVAVGEKQEASIISPKTLCKKSSSLAKNCELTVGVNGRDEKTKLTREVRAFPPSPQRIPSPSSRRQLQSAKDSHKANFSPLSKASKSKAQENGVLQELEPRKEKRVLIANNEECNGASVASEAEGSLADLFWFLKPCTYLVK
ncbi:hypothetical protein HPP92_019959 [Vanilla planifolia]|uniref:Uncharacterized protein n=1 Tax=Vanilla planifolia TaxID=51239 RepID=A0A835Q7R3_VANPL|nr:hypothetical protein HPP92_019959 [Vanilla planifolia]